MHILDRSFMHTAHVTSMCVDDFHNANNMTHMICIIAFIIVPHQAIGAAACPLLIRSRLFACAVRSCDL